MFRIGLFLLPSSALLAGLCFLVACIAGSRQSSRWFWWDPWLRPLLLAGVLMMIGAVVAQTGLPGLGGSRQLVAPVLGLLGVPALCADGAAAARCGLDAAWLAPCRC